jgi:Ca2+-binding EF-hand superfamily protein
MRSASEDDESRAQIRRQERQKRMNALTEMLSSLDTDKDGTVSYQELEAAIHTAEIEKMCHLLDISGADLLGLFKLIDIDKKGEIDLNEFVLSLFRCHAEPQGVDMVRMTKNQAHMAVKLEYCMSSLDRIEGMIAQLLPANQLNISKESNGING